MYMCDGYSSDSEYSAVLRLSMQRRASKADYYYAESLISMFRADIDIIMLPYVSLVRTQGLNH